MQLDTSTPTSPSRDKWPIITNAPKRRAATPATSACHWFQAGRSVSGVPFLAPRKINIVLNFAEALWYLSGRNDWR
jgi:hypothetical protein